MDLAIRQHPLLQEPPLLKVGHAALAEERTQKRERALGDTQHQRNHHYLVDV